ncbi:MAG TPA: hypothetical protein VNO53_03820 [Steroidobacteraceae bacterium]|nr:hypothetical protein [Steroidobacteraceae bacterium]
MHTEISPWIERIRPHRLAIGIGAGMLLLAVALAWVAWRWGVAEDRMVLMQKQAEAGFLQAPSTNRTVRIDLRAPRAVSLGGGDFPERVDFLVNARTSRYVRFRVNLQREDGTLIFRTDQMVRDSNQDLRLSLNTSMLPQGSYVLRVEGNGRGGKLEQFGEAQLRVAGR